MNSGRFHGGHFFFRGSLASGDDRTRMTHTASRRRRLTADKSDDGFLYVGFDVRGRVLFSITPDFAHHDDGVRVRIRIKEFDGVDEVGSDDRVATNSNAGGLAQSSFRQLSDGFIS